MGALVSDAPITMVSTRELSYSARNLAVSDSKLAHLLEENHAEKKLAEDAKLEKWMSNELQGKTKEMRRTSTCLSRLVSFDGSSRFNAMSVSRPLETCLQHLTAIKLTARHTTKLYGTV